MSGDERYRAHHGLPDESDETGEASVANVIAVAAAVIASTEAADLQQRLDAADIAAAVAWARVPPGAAKIFESQRATWLASQDVAEGTPEYNVLARRSVLAATLAAQILARGVDTEEGATRAELRDAIAEILTAEFVVQPRPLH